MVKKTKKTIGTETVIAYVAIVIAVITGIVAIYEAQINRKYQSISIWPHLRHSINTSYGTAAKFEVVLENKGLGPAVIKTHQIFVDGVPVANWREAFLILSDETYDFYEALENAQASRSTIFPDHTVLPGEEIQAALVVDNDIVALLDQNLSRLEIVTCYCSLYGECWQLKGFSEPAQEVAQCPARTE